VSDPRFKLSSVLLISAVVGAAAFAAGRSTSDANVAATTTIERATTEPPQLPSTERAADGLPPGHPAPTGELPPGHPSVPSGDPGEPSPHEHDRTLETERELSWTAPPRWKSVPNASSMRLATYQIPRVPTDTQDPELAVMQAGGSVDANVERWVGQFGDEGKRSVERTRKTVAGLAVTMVSIKGTYSGGMGADARPSPGWALLGAIVETPGMPHFFKLTGPAKSVAGARAELDGLVASLRTAP